MEIPRSTLTMSCHADSLTHIQSYQMFGDLNRDRDSYRVGYLWNQIVVVPQRVDATQYGHSTCNMTCAPCRDCTYTVLSRFVFTYDTEELLTCVPIVDWTPW